jgi:hypothetical protein
MEVAMDITTRNALVDDFLLLLAECGILVSHFKHLSYCPIHVNGAMLLHHFLESEAIQDICDNSLGNIYPQYARYSLLNRYEFEGSLLTILREGGKRKTLSRKPTNDLHQMVVNGLNRLCPAPHSLLQVFRMDDQRWCELTRDAEKAVSYLAYQPERKVWWVLVIADCH